MGAHNAIENLEKDAVSSPSGTDLNLSNLDVSTSTLTASSGIVGEDWVVTVPLDALSVDMWAAVAPFACTLAGVTEVHSVISTGAATLGIRKVTANSQAPGASAGASVVELLASAIDLNGVAANTLTTASLSAVAGALTVAAGNRIGFDFSAAVTGLVGCVVTMRFVRS